MAAAVRLREDFDAERLLVLARGSKEAPQSALASRALGGDIDDGGARSEAAKIGGVTLQIVRDWRRASTHMARTASSIASARQPSLMKDEHRTALRAWSMTTTHPNPLRRALADR